MWPFQPNRFGRGRVLGLVTLGALGFFCGFPAYAADPVTELKLALPLRLEDMRNPTAVILKHREDTLTKRINALKTVGEIRRALSLSEWKEDTSGNMQIRDIDLRMRKNLGQRFLEIIEETVKKGDTVSRLAVANMIAEIGPSVRALEPADLGGLTRSLAPFLAALTADPDLGVRQEALRALGNINADPKIAVPVFVKTLQKDTVGPRRLAAEGLGQMIRVVNYLQKRGRTESGVEATRKDVIAVVLEVVQAVPAGLGDSDAQVRGQSLETLQLATSAVGELVQDAFPKSSFPPEGRPLNEGEKKDIDATHKLVHDEVEEVSGMLAALKGQAPHLARAVKDPQPGVRLQAALALENLANIRLRVRRRVLSVPLGDRAEKEVSAYLEANDPLVDFLRQDLASVATLVAEEDVRIRRAAVDMLETLESAATPLLPALVTALEDNDRFVRWAAARAVGALPAERCGPAVPGLGRLLLDTDLNVRLAAATTLESLGDAAHAAIPTLTQACTTGDAESRIAAMLVLLRIGPKHGRPAIPALIGALRHHEARVRRTAAETLGQFGPEARSAVPVLRELLGDGDTEVRVQASDALLNILRQRKKL